MESKNGRQKVMRDAPTNPDKPPPLPYKYFKSKIRYLRYGIRYPGYWILALDQTPRHQVPGTSTVYGPNPQAQGTRHKERRKKRPHTLSRKRGGG